MKTKYLVITVLFSIFYLPLFANTYTIDQNSTISLTTGYVNNMNEIWNVVSTVTDKPLIISYTIGTESSYDFLTINNVDNSGNVTSQLLRISGTKSGFISTTAPNGRVQIVFTSDGSVCYANNPSVYSGITVTFSVNNNQIVGNGSFVNGNSCISGNVGIGTFNPQDLLEVYGANSIPRIALKFTGTNQAAKSYISSVTDGHYMEFGTFGSTFSGTLFGVGMAGSNSILMAPKTFGYGLLGTTTSAPLVIGTNSVERIRITTAGNVGIGTTSPQAKLDINGEIRSSLNGGVSNLRIIGGGYGAMFRNDGAYTYLLLTNNNDISGGSNSLRPWYVNNSTGDILFADGKVQITHSTGNVGIGTTTPGYKLDVAGDIQLNGRIGFNLRDTTTYDSKTMGNYSLGWFSDTWSTAGYTLWQSAWGGMKFFTNGTPRMAITNGGNVLIGTTKPDSTGILLTVNGIIHAKEVKIDLNIPADYVFKPTYKLMPLNQVEQYVKTNSHLPEIPSAGEITKNGLSMGEMQNKLLQKVEELTLYVIEQQKEIEQLKQQLKK